MKYSKELHERVRQNLRMFDCPCFDNSDIDALLDEIERRQVKWIPVSEKLPYVKDKRTIGVIAVNMDGDKKPFACLYSNDFGFEWLIATHWIYTEDLLRILPLPEQKDEK